MHGVRTLFPETLKTERFIRMQFTCCCGLFVCSHFLEAILKIHNELFMKWYQHTVFPEFYVSALKSEINNWASILQSATYSKEIV